MKKLPVTSLSILFGLLVGALIASWHVVIDFTKEMTDSYSFADAVNNAAPAIVNIYTSTINENISQQGRATHTRGLSLGSGIIMHSNGYVATNLHVLKNAQSILVLLYDGRQAEARVIGIDEETDIAILKIELADLTASKLGSSLDMRVGDSVLAIGNPYGFGQTVTSGIISAKGRYGLNFNTYENFIQTDAAINVGSSGGGLINTRGEIIGMNTANYTQSGASSGIAFATPIETVFKVLKDIIQHGYVMRGWLGLEVTQINPNIAKQLDLSQNGGVMITRTHLNGPAHQAGLKPKDIILSIDNKSIVSGRQGLLEVAELMPGKVINIEVLRGKERFSIKTRIGIRPNLYKPKRNQ